MSRASTLTIPWPNVARGLLTLRRRPLIARALTFLEHVSDMFPWTPLGILLCAGAGFGLRHFAYVELDLVWLVLGYGGLALLVLAPLLVVPAALYLRFLGTRAAGLDASESTQTQSGGQVLRLETGISRTTGFSIAGLWWVPLVQVRWAWTSPVATVTRTSEAGRLVEHTMLPARGSHSSVLRKVWVADALGLSRVSFKISTPQRVDVLPALGKLSSSTTFSSFAAGADLPHPQGMRQGDRIDLRHYQHGDPVRFIHWKVFARSRSLVVRTPEAALSEAQRVAAFLVSGTNDEASAAVARLALIRGFFGSDYLFGTAQQPEGVGQEQPALDLLIRSVEARGSGEHGLERFVAAAQRGGPASIVLFLPATPGPWLPHVLNVVRHHRARVILGVDGLRASYSQPAFLSWLLSNPEREGHSANEVLSVVRDCRQAGATVAVYDRRSGQLIDNGRISAIAQSSGRVARDSKRSAQGLA